MKLNLNIVKLRGTVFTQQVNYSPQIVIALSDVLPGFLPSFVTVIPQNNSVPNAIVSNFWEMVNPNTGERVQFNNLKIDIIQNCDTPYKEEIISNFSDHCSNVFCRIAEITGQPSSRLAIAPTFSCTDDNQKIKQFAQGIYVNNSFKEAIIDNCAFNNIFRIKEVIGEKTYLINYLANVYAANRVDNIEGKNLIRETIAVDFDINTFANEGYIFSVPDIKAFFDKSSQMSKSFFDFFFADNQ